MLHDFLRDQSPACLEQMEPVANRKKETTKINFESEAATDDLCISNAPNSNHYARVRNPFFVNPSLPQTGLTTQGVSVCFAFWEAIDSPVCIT